MKCIRMTRLASIVAAALACGSAHADAADLMNQGGMSFYGYGGGFAPGMAGYGGAGYAPGMAGYGGAGYAPGMAGYGGAGYAAGYAGYGAGGSGPGGCGAGGCGAGGGGRIRRHHCSFGGNSACCAGVWDGYCGAGGGCGPAIKVRRRHRALGCGAGPCVDAAACGQAAVAPRVHRCHLRRWLNRGGATCNAGCGCQGGAGMTFDQAPMQPGMASPNSAEPLEAPMPGVNSDEPPAPAEESST